MPYANGAHLKQDKDEKGAKEREGEREGKRGQRARRNANNAPQEAPPENLNKFLHISCCPLLLLCLLSLSIVVVIVAALAVAAVHIAVAFAVYGALQLQLDTVFNHAHLFAMSTRVR